MLLGDGAVKLCVQGMLDLNVQAMLDYLEN